MNENHQDKTKSKLIATKNKSQLLAFSPEDEKEAQKELDRLRKSLRENENGTVNVNRKLSHKRTGFEDKTLWDWLQLLLIPLVLTVGGFLFSAQQHATDQQSALDQQRQAILITYEDDMKDLLLNRGLLTSKSDDEIRVLARAETYAAMRQLDGKRNGMLVQFLHDARLIGFDINTRDNSIVNFKNANLSSTDLSYANLNSANLNGVNLSGADLSHADLGDADLSHAYLDSANLSYASLVDTDLSYTDLTGAKLTQQQLDQVYSCKNAILSRGLTCHHNI